MIVVHLLAAHRRDEDALGVVRERELEEPRAPLLREPVRLVAEAPHGGLGGGAGEEHEEAVAPEDVPEDVNDDGEPARFPRAAQQALATDVRHG